MRGCRYWSSRPACFLGVIVTATATATPPSNFTHLVVTSEQQESVADGLGNGLNYWELRIKKIPGPRLNAEATWV